jgi:cell wall-associated NlpC family hydrolase
VRGVLLTLVAVIALCISAQALASAGYVRVLDPGGATLAVGSGPHFAYPADGSIVSVSSAAALPGDTLLENVQLLGGQLDLSQIDLFGNGTISVGTLIVGGHTFSASVPNRLVQLGAAGYAVVDQAARLDGHVGRVALRLVVNSVPGVPVGTQVVIARTQSAQLEPNRLIARSNALDVLGFSPTFTASIAFLAPPSTTSGPIGERAVALAEQFLGEPYVWGGASPLTGFDCSGLAMYVYGLLGITLTHYTGAQITEGIPVMRADLAPGDLIFFEPNAQGVPQHEGIYVGNGQFIQAPHTGDVVKISSLDDPQYGLSMVGAVRPYVRLPG